MALLNFLLSRKENTADIAEEWLQTIVTERRRSDTESHYLPQLRKDISEVICKYTQTDPEMVAVQPRQKDGGTSILGLNVILPEAEELKQARCKSAFIFKAEPSPPRVFHPSHPRCDKAASILADTIHYYFPLPLYTLRPFPRTEQNVYARSSK